MTRDQPPPSHDTPIDRGVEHAFAWAANAVVCVYFGWIAVYLWRSTSSFAQMYEGMGAQLPAATRLVVEHGSWFYPTLFGVLVLGLVGKEFFIRDKRTSVMATFLVATVGQFASHWLTTLYYLPMFEMIRKLSE